MQMMQIAFLASPPAHNQRTTSKPTSKTFRRCTLLAQHVPSSRVPFAGHPPQTPLPTHFVRQAQLSWRLLRRLAFVTYATIPTAVIQTTIFLLESFQSFPLPQKQYPGSIPGDCVKAVLPQRALLAEGPQPFQSTRLRDRSFTRAMG